MMYATKIPWETTVRGQRYGTDDTYIKAAEWLFACKTVSDWGGGRGYFKKWLTAGTEYILVDGTRQDASAPTIIANLGTYREPSEGILLRHVLEMTEDWQVILRNAVRAFCYRMVVVTFTPNVKVTHVHTHHLTWPCYHFNHEQDLIPEMQPYLVRFEDVTIRKTLPERLYYLERKYKQ
jgi:hypothetical protein